MQITYLGCFALIVSGHRKM